MSSSEKLPSGYSFRRGTFAELQARNSKIFGWIFIVISVLAIVISIRSILETYPAHSREVEVIALSTNGKLLVTGGQDRNESNEIWTVKVWDAQTLKLLNTLPGYSTFLTSLTISPDGQTIVFNDCCSTKLWNWRNNKYISDVDGIKHDTVLSPNSANLIGVGSDRKTIAIANLHNLLQSSANK
ncbi:MAG: WD40 repeat domain-containing protein [Aulosira sp. ZfuVER01]|nr:hypothetical protein [Aulosira sp. ZfuVER01]MDZ8000460.1 hypothetical protein [Aulosira sp. DedVER01a]MDZ8052932.1 hypothetical protein [Aulosira sp. ZfuCHP01]